MENTDIKYGNISLNGKFVASLSLHAFKKSNMRGTFEDHYKNENADKVDENMELAWKKCVEAFPPTETGNIDPKKAAIAGAVLVDFKVNQAYIDANPGTTEVIGNTIQISADEVKKYMKK